MPAAPMFNGLGVDCVETRLRESKKKRRKVRGSV